MSTAPVADHPPLVGAQRALGTLALSAATFMNVLDTSIANVSLPAIAGDLGVSPVQGTWVITSFAVANAIAVPLTGWLTQRIGAVRLFMASVLLFVLSSWLCGMAPNMTTLIAFRALQGDTFRDLVHFPGEHAGNVPANRRFGAKKGGILCDAAYRNHCEAQAIPGRRCSSSRRRTAGCAARS